MACSFVGHEPPWTAILKLSNRKSNDLSQRALLPLCDVLKWPFRNYNSRKLEDFFFRWLEIKKKRKMWTSWRMGETHKNCVSFWCFEALTSENKYKWHDSSSAQCKHKHQLDWSTHTSPSFHSICAECAPQSTKCHAESPILSRISVRVCVCVCLCFSSYLDHAIMPRNANSRYCFFFFRFVLWADWCCGFVLSLKFTYIRNLIFASMNFDEMKKINK